MADEVKVDKNLYRNTKASALLHGYYVNMDGRFVMKIPERLFSIERNEIVLERDSILDDSNIAMILEMDVKSIFVQKEESDWWLCYHL